MQALDGQAASGLIGSEAAVRAGADADTHLSAGTLAHFRRDGFALVRALSPPEEVARIRAVYDDMFANRRGWDKGDFFDTRAADDETEAMSLPQMFWMSRYEPSLLETEYHRRAGALARAILGPGAKLVWEFAILKPPRVGGETPWHQDDAFFTVGTPYDEAVSFWMPLQDVGPHNGCMRYVPGSNHGPLFPHDHVGGDPRTHGLEAIGADVSGARELPMAAGDCAFHHSRTLHGAGPNPSDAPRRAYILEFASPDPSKMRREDYPWNREKHTARDERERRSQPLRQRLRRQIRLAVTRLCPRA